MSTILTPGERPDAWRTVGDHDRRIRALEALENCCGDDEDCVSFPDRIADLVTDGMDLLGYWRLGETGTPWADISGNSGGPKDATEAGSGAAVTADVTGALANDANGAVQINEGKYLNAPDAPPRRFNLNAGAMTVAAWVKPLATARATVIANVASCWASGAFGDAGWTLSMVQTPSAHTIEFTRRETGTPAQAATAGPEALAEDEWVFVVGTYDGTEDHNLYVNGVLVAQDIANDVTNLPSNNTGVTIGGPPGGASSGEETLSVVIDEVTVWGDALTSDQIVTLYSSGLPCTSTSVVDSIEASGGGQLTGDVTFSEGTNVTMTTVGNDIEIAASGGSPIDDTAVWMPLTTVVAGDPVLVWDGDDSLIPTLIPI